MKWDGPGLRDDTPAKLLPVASKDPQWLATTEPTCCKMQPRMLPSLTLVFRTVSDHQILFTFSSRNYHSKW